MVRKTRTLFHITAIILGLFLAGTDTNGQDTSPSTTRIPATPTTTLPPPKTSDFKTSADETNGVEGNGINPNESLNSSTTSSYMMVDSEEEAAEEEEEEEAEEFLQDVCSEPTQIRNYCTLPDELVEFLHANVTLQDMGNFLLSQTVIDDLKSQCSPGSWCLDSEAVSEEIAGKVKFWMNSTDFDMTCWPDLSQCMEYIADFYYNCDNYEALKLISDMNVLLCEMKNKPMAPSTCIEQTIKSLHVSMADVLRPIEDITLSDEAPVCERREAMMTRNFLCTTAMCEKYDATLYEFRPWGWIVSTIDELKEKCELEDKECLRKAEEEDFDEIISTLLEDDSKVHQTNWLLEQMDLRTIIIIAVLSVSTIGAISLLILVFWRRRKMKVRVRDGMEYMEIKPEETEAFLESSVEIGDDTKLMGNCKEF